jgi:hypothetical protein
MDYKVEKEEVIDNAPANCGTKKLKWFAFGIVPTGIISIGVVPMGVVSIGVVPMGVVSIGSVAMGAIAAGFVSMGMFTAGTVSMSLNQGHASNLKPAPEASPSGHHHH